MNVIQGAFITLRFASGGGWWSSATHTWLRSIWRNKMAIVLSRFMQERNRGTVMESGTLQFAGQTMAGGRDVRFVYSPVCGSVYGSV